MEIPILVRRFLYIAKTHSWQNHVDLGEVLMNIFEWGLINYNLALFETMARFAFRMRPGHLNY